MLPVANIDHVLNNHHVIVMVFGKLDHLAHGGAAAFFSRVDSLFTPQVKLMGPFALAPFGQRVIRTGGAEPGYVRAWVATGMGLLQVCNIMFRRGMIGIVRLNG